MNAYWLSIEVHLSAPLVLVSDDGTTERARLTGFVQELGVTAPDDPSMEHLVRTHVGAHAPGGSGVAEVLLLEIERLARGALEDLCADLREAAGSVGRPGAAEGVAEGSEEVAGSSAAAAALEAIAAGALDRAGIWYEGSRAFYSEDPA